MKVLFATSLLLAMFATAKAADQGSYKVVKDTNNYVLNADATFTNTGTLGMTVLTEQGIGQLNQADISYSSSLEELTVLEAYTRKKDGRRIDVPAANIQDRDVVDGGGPMYSDFKGKVIIFPNLEVGDTTVYTLRDVQKVPMFPGQFSLMELFDRDTVVEDREISISAPVQGPVLQTFAQGVEGGRLPDKDGRALWHWRWHNDALADDDDYLPADERPRLLVSSFKDFGALAQAYEDRARSRAVVTPKIQAQADALTQGLSQPADEARALYTWVARNIRYAGNCIGVGSVVPHDASVVLENRLGDCKDHTALLQALLAAKGIESNPVLVNSGSRYKLPEVPVPGYFNHVINYIPGLQTYADSTSDFIPFGSLPYGEAGKVALHTEHFAGVLKTPAASWKDYEARLKNTVNIKADGTVEGRVDVSAGPLAAMSVRQYYADREPAQDKDTVRGIFTGSGIAATGEVFHDDPRAGTNPYRYGISFDAKNVLNLPGAGGFRVASYWGSSMPISAWARRATGKPIKHAYGCNGSLSVEDYEYTFPAGMKILWLPHDIHASTPAASYDATYRQVGRTITAHRELQYRIETHLCTPEEGEALRPIGQAVAKDLRAQILYQMD